MDRLELNRVIWIFALILLVSTAYAGSPNPETYWGYVYSEGVLVAAGTILTVESTSTGELFINKTLPYDPGYPGSYSIILNFDDTYTPADEGADLNEQLTWKVNGISASIPAPGDDIAESGNTNNGYRIDVVFPPSVSAVLQQSASNLTLGDSMSLTVILNNTGQGIANSTLASIDDSGVTTDLPKTLFVGVNDTNQTTVNITPTTCGEHTPTLEINNYDSLGTLIDTLNEQFSFNTTGADLILDGVNLSDSNPTEGDSISIMSTVRNNGTLNITGFSVAFYYDSTLIDTLTSNETLSANESIGISANWDAVLGASTIRLVLSTSGLECSSTNNEESTGISVQAAPQQDPGSGGGGGGGVGGYPQCNDNKDNDYDGFIDLSDPGCASLNDNDERDEYDEVIGGIEGKTEEEAEEEEIGQIPEIDETIEYEEEPKEEQPKEEKKSLVTGFAVLIRENSFSLLLLLIIILIAILTYRLFRHYTQQSEQGEVKPGEFHKQMTDYVEKQKKEEIEEAEERSRINKRIKEMPEPEEKSAAKPHLTEEYTNLGRKEKDISKQLEHLREKEMGIARDEEVHTKEHPKKPTHKMGHAKKHGKIQKSIKISSKKEIIDKLKEVYEENG
ncbi:hypothetical protein KY345_01725 [Candidatus Woesearchaeota archaeon]|nr:hypothetical protein [Candidatus Woesearchaeota archaeon]